MCSRIVLGVFIIVAISLSCKQVSDQVMQEENEPETVFFYDFSYKIIRFPDSIDLPYAFKPPNFDHGRVVLRMEVSPQNTVVGKYFGRIVLYDNAGNTIVHQVGHCKFDLTNLECPGAVDPYIPWLVEELKKVEFEFDNREDHNVPFQFRLIVK